MAKTYYFKDEEEERKYFDNKREMEENSRKWHETDDPDEKANLHFRNQVLSGEQDLFDGGNRTFDENTGEWNVDYGNKSQNNLPWKNEQDDKYEFSRNDDIDALYDEIVNQKAFSYDPELDPSYKAYENMYRREGDRASKSTLADISTAQGGVSSYAASAAQQAANAYAQGLTDKIPELEALAYQKYSADRNDKYNQLNSLMALDNLEYGRYIDDRNFDYQIDRDKVSDKRYEEEWDYQKGRDNVNDERYEREWNYGVSRDAINDERYGIERADNEYLKRQNEVESAFKGGYLEALPDDRLMAAGYNPTELRRQYSIAKYGYDIYSSNGYSGGKGGVKKKTVDEPKTEPEEHIIQEYPLTYEDYQIEQIEKRLEKGEITETEAKRLVDEIVNGG